MIEYNGIIIRNASGGGDLEILNKEGIFEWISSQDAGAILGKDYWKEASINKMISADYSAAMKMVDEMIKNGEV